MSECLYADMIKSNAWIWDILCGYYVYTDFGLRLGAKIVDDITHITIMDLSIIFSKKEISFIVLYNIHSYNNKYVTLQYG